MVPRKLNAGPRLDIEAQEICTGDELLFLGAISQGPKGCSLRAIHGETKRTNSRGTRYITGAQGHWTFAMGLLNMIFCNLFNFFLFFRRNRA